MSTSTEEKKKIITLKSSDNEVFEVEEVVVSQSETINNMIEDGCADDGIPLPNVTGSTLAKVIEYCKKHVGESADGEKQSADGEKEELKKWDAEFVKVDEKVMFDLILAANYLNIKGLLDVTCQAVANAIKDFTPEQIRAKFNIINDFSEEEEAEVRRENAWAFEK